MRVRVLERCFIDNRIVESGATIEVAGKPAAYMVPVDDDDGGEDAGLAPVVPIKVRKPRAPKALKADPVSVEDSPAT